MKLEIQKNEKIMEIDNFQDYHFQEIESNFYQPYFRSRYIDRRGLYEYIDTMKLFNKTVGSHMDSDFPVMIRIYLEEKEV